MEGGVDAAQGMRTRQKVDFMRALCTERAKEGSSPGFGSLRPRRPWSGTSASWFCLLTSAPWCQMAN